jgi:hypothetical protein
MGTIRVWNRIKFLSRAGAAKNDALLRCMHIRGFTARFKTKRSAEHHSFFFLLNLPLLYHFLVDFLRKPIDRTLL